MPRRREIDEEDMLVQCPRCQGDGTVVNPAAGVVAAGETEAGTARIECPLCLGACRVNRHVYETYQRP